MFGQSSTLDAPVPYLGNPNAPAQQQPYGVSSAITDLISEVKMIAGVANDLKSALGISYPKELAKSPESGDSLVGALRVAAATLRSSYGDLGDCLNHIRN